MSGRDLYSRQNLPRSFRRSLLSHPSRQRRSQVRQEASDQNSDLHPRDLNIEYLIRRERHVFRQSRRSQWNFIISASIRSADKHRAETTITIVPVVAPLIGRRAVITVPINCEAGQDILAEIFRTHQLAVKAVAIAVVGHSGDRRPRRNDSITPIKRGARSGNGSSRNGHEFYPAATDLSFKAA
jgi:hypothetical protein